MPLVKSDSQNYTDIANTVRELTASEETYTPAQMPEGVDEVYDAACSAFGCKESVSGNSPLRIAYVNPAEHIVPVKLSSKNLIKLELGKMVNDKGEITYFTDSNTRSAASQFIPIDKYTTYCLSEDSGTVVQSKISFFDKDFNYIGRSPQGAFSAKKRVITINLCSLGTNAAEDKEKARYIIVNIWATDYNPLGHNVQLELGTSGTEYTEHIEDFSGATLTTKNIGADGALEFANLPSEYQQVEYIESTGVQYIDTGFIPDDNSGFDIVYITNSNVGSSGYGTILGSRYDSRNTEFHLTTFNSEVRFGNNTYNGGITVGELMHSVLKNKVYTSNSVTTNLSGEFVAPGNLTVFALNVRGSITQYSKTRVYSLKLYDGDSLIRDYVPCYRKEDEVSGFFDLVTNEFYTNKKANTVDFIRGEIVNETINASYAVNEDGTVDNVKSISPSMLLSVDMQGAVINADYYVDGQARLDTLTDIILELGGEL